MNPGIIASWPLGGGPPPPVVYTPPNSANLRYWYKTDEEVYSDVAGTTLCADGDGAANWKNWGLSEDAIQTTSANRPTYKTGGLAGRPYLSLDRAVAQFFENLLDCDQPGGILGHNKLTFAAVFSHLNIAGGSNPILMAAGSTDKARVEVLDNGAGVPRLSWWKSQVLQDDAAMLDPCSVIGTVRTISTFDRNINGTNTTQSQSTNASPRVGNTSTEFLRRTQNGSYFTGRLYEFMYWNTNLAYTSSIDDVRAYFASKYGI